MTGNQYGLANAIHSIERAARDTKKTEIELINEWMFDLDKKPKYMRQYIWLLYDHSEYGHPTDTDDAAIWMRVKRTTAIHIASGEPIGYTGD